MKKIIYLSTLLVFLFSISGCNLFESVDKEKQSDADVFYYNAQSIINSGDTAKLAELETLILERITVLETDNTNPEEVANLELMLADVRLSLSGVDLLNTATKLFEMVNNADDLEATATNITSIISMDADQLAKLDLACQQYATLDKTPDVENLTTEERNTYMTAGIANAIYSANLILNVFDVNGDGSVNSADSTALFGSAAPVVSSTKSVRGGYNGSIPTYSAFITFWKEQKPLILEYLGNAAIYLNIALNTYGINSSTDNSELVDTIDKIKADIAAYDDISEADFNKIINIILTGKN